jgi:FkbM family methyltransferase
VSVSDLGSAGRHVQQVVRKLGVVGAAHYLVKARLLGALRILAPWANVKSRPYSLLSPECSTAMWCRPHTSDRLAFAQIFIERGYPLPRDLQPKLIIDCGANVGYASLFFLSRYPGARVIALEPDDRNYDLLTRNLQPFGDRVHMIHGAIWPRETGLRVVKGCFGDGLEWATQVRECHAGEAAELTGTTIASLMARSRDHVVDLLKLDIEGAEAELFAGNLDWIDKVLLLVIELHGPESSRTFHRAMLGRPFKISVCGELTIAERVQAA